MIQMLNKGVINKNTIEKENLDWLWLSIVFLFSLNFYAKPNHLLLSLLIIGLIMMFYKRTTFMITIDLLLISLFSISYFIILLYNGYGGLGFMFIFLIGPIACFFVGYSIVKIKGEFIIKTMLAITLGSFIHGFLNMISFFRLHGFSSFIIGARTILDIWTNSAVTATLQGTYYTLITSLLFYSFLLLKKKGKRILAVILIFSVIFSLMASFVMGNRTLIAIMLITIGASLLLYSILIKKEPKEIIKICLLIVLVFGLF